MHTMHPSVFVSHSSVDAVWCRELVGQLKGIGYDVWYDEVGLGGGLHWVATI
jgi:hypothetical protein